MRRKRCTSRRKGSLVADPLWKSEIPFNSAAACQLESITARRASTSVTDGDPPRCPFAAR